MIAVAVAGIVQVLAETACGRRGDECPAQGFVAVVDVDANGSIGLISIPGPAGDNAAIRDVYIAAVILRNNVGREKYSQHAGVEDRGEEVASHGIRVPKCLKSK